MKILKAFFFSLFAACALFSCDSNKAKAPAAPVKRDSVSIQEGFVTGTSSACTRFEDFFEDEESGKKFFPVGEWLFDFDYEPNKQELYLTHLNAKVNDMYVNSIFIINDTIKINETKRVVDSSVVIEDTNIEYKLENVQPKTYVICINDNVESCVFLNLAEIQADSSNHENYSLFDDGSVLIANNDTSFCESDANGSSAKSNIRETVKN